MPSLPAAGVAPAAAAPEKDHAPPPKPLPESFSYAAAAASLRAFATAPEEKLQTCTHLLSVSAHLTPLPHNLILSYLLRVLGTAPPEHPHLLAQQWTLLRSTLSTHPAPPRLPQKLLSSACTHLSTASAPLPAAIAHTLPFLTTHRTAPPQTPAPTAQLLAALLPHLRTTPSLAPDVSALLSHQYSLHARARDPRKVLAASAVLLRSTAQSTLWPRCRAPLARGLFAHLDISLSPLYDSLTAWSGPLLPPTAAFVLRSAVAAARDSLHRSKSAVDLPPDVRAALRVLDGLLRTLVQAAADDNNVAAGFPDFVRAIAAVLRAAAELDVYRPSYDVGPDRRPKRPRTAAAAAVGQGPVCVGETVRALFAQLVSWLRREQAAASPRDGAMEAVCDTIRAVLAFSVDVVEQEVPSLLDACFEREIRHAELQPMCDLFCGIVEAYRQTRMLPSLFRRLEESKLGLSVFRCGAALFAEQSVQNSLARAVAALPRGQPPLCITELMAGEKDIGGADVPCVAFIVALVLEAVNLEETAAVLDAVQKSVLPLMLAAPSTPGVRSGIVFLLSSMMFAATRANIKSSSTDFCKLVVGQRLVQACGFSWLDVGGDDMHNVETRLFRSVADKLGRENFQSMDATECFVIVRLLSVTVHSLLYNHPSVDLQDSAKDIIYLMFTAYSRLLSVQPDAEFWPGANLFHNHLPCEAAVPSIGSVSQVLDLTASGEQLPAGFVEFISFAAEQYESDEQLWEDLLECTTVQHVLPSALSMCFTKADARKQSCQGAKGNSSRCRLQRVVRFLRALPPNYISIADEEQLADAIDKAYSKLCCSAAQQKAANAVISLMGASVVCIRAALPLASRSDSEKDVLLLLLQRIERGIVPAKDGAVLIDDALKYWTERLETDPGCLPALLENVEQSVSELESSRLPTRAVVCTTRGILKSAQRFCQETPSADVLNEQTGDVLRIVSALLRLRLALRKVARTGGETAQLSSDIDSFLSVTFEKSVTISTNVVCGSGKGVISSTTLIQSREFLRSSCQGLPPAYRVYDPSGALFNASRMCALSLHLLRRPNTCARSVGVEMLCAIGNNEQSSVVMELAEVIHRELENSRKFPEDISALPMSPEDAQRLQGFYELMYSQVLAAASLFCGCDRNGEEDLVLLSVEDSTFSGFKDVRKRRDLSGVPLERESSARLVISLVHKAGKLLKSSNGLRRMDSQDRDVNELEMQRIVDIVWESTHLALQATEVALERRPPARLDGVHIQELLVELASLCESLTHSEVSVKAHVNIVQTLLARICRSLLHHHGGSVRWPAVRLLCCLLHQPNVSSSAAEAISSSYTELAARAGGIGHDVVRAALSDVCDGLAQYGTLDTRRAIMPGIAELLATAGDKGVQAVMNALQPNAKEVLRQARETYARDFQYRGK